jgi:hypothetical protein
VKEIEMRIRMLPAALALALTLGLAGATGAAPAAGAAPAKFRDVLTAFKGQDVMVANASKATDAKPRKLMLVGDDYFAVELPDGRRNYFLYTRVASVQVVNGVASVFLVD